MNGRDEGRLERWTSKTGRSLPLQTASPRLSIHLFTTDDDRLLRVFSEAFKAVVSV